MLSAGVWTDGINHISGLSLLLTSHLCCMGRRRPSSPPTLTDEHFFIEILILVPATPESINNQTQLRMSNVEIFIRFIPKQLKIVSIDVV